MPSLIKYIEKPKLEEPTAIVASPGLRSVGIIAIKHLIKELRPKLFAELYSIFPVIYYGIPYLGSFGEIGVSVENGLAYLPKIELYYTNKPEMIITKGYQAEFTSQHEVASKVVDLFEEFNVKRIIVLAAHGSGGKRMFFAATNQGIAEEMIKLGILKREAGEFFGFSALILGIAALRGIDGFCLFAETTPATNPENPDFDAARRILEKLNEMLGLDIDASKLKENSGLKEKEHNKTERLDYFK